VSEHFVSELIKPATDAIDTRGMGEGSPGLPMVFSWRGQEYHVSEILSQWKETRPEKHTTGEKYLRKHWFHVRTDEGWEMKIYFQRKPSSAKTSLKRWWLYTAKEPVK
jgi:hypothetical protein